MDDWKYKPAKDLGLPPGQRLRSLNRESGLTELLIGRMWWRAVRLYMAAGHRLRISGREHLPARLPFILIANHSSHLDALALASILPTALRERVFPVAAGDTFFETPTLTAFAAICMNALPIWRRNCGRHALEQLRERLVEEPCGYILFPEGTRTRDGEMKSFKPGLGMLVAETSTAVVPCRLRGAFEALPPNRRFPRPTKIELRIGKALDFSQVPNGREGWERIARKSEDAVREL